MFFHMPAISFTWKLGISTVWEVNKSKCVSIGKIYKAYTAVYRFTIFFLDLQLLESEDWTKISVLAFRKCDSPHVFKDGPKTQNKLILWTQDIGRQRQWSQEFHFNVTFFKTFSWFFNILVFLLQRHGRKVCMTFSPSSPAWLNLQEL